MTVVKPIPTLFLQTNHNIKSLYFVHNIEDFSNESNETIVIPKVSDLATFSTSEKQSQKQSSCMHAFSCTS